MSEKEDEDDPVALAEPATSNSSMGNGGRTQARRPTRFALEAQARKVSSGREPKSTRICLQLCKDV